MKKFLAVAIGMAMVAGAAYAQSQTFSKNAVGFINIEAKAGKLYALTFPLDNMAEGSGGAWKFEDTQLAQDAGAGSSVYFWDGTGWTPFNKGRNGFGITDDFATLQPGQCFFFEPADDMTITIAGEVPDSPTTGVAIAGAENLTAIGNPYPTPLKFEDTTLAQEAAAGSAVYFWDGTGWTPFNKGRNGFAVDEEFATVQPGYGFFFQTTDEDESSEWSVEKGYTWP